MKYTKAALTQLHEAAVRSALQEKLNDLNQAIFYESANPKGQFVKDLIFVELDKLEADRIAALQKHSTARQQTTDD